MIYALWLVLLSLIIISFYYPQFPLWISLLYYVSTTTIKAIGKIGNYHDDIKKIGRDEERKVEENMQNFQIRGLGSSGVRLKEENRIKQDFEHLRRERERQFHIELMDSFILK